MSLFLRKVRTASGATAVQIVSKSGGVRRIVEHLGSAHDEAGREALLEAGRQKIAAGQGQGLLDLEFPKAGTWTYRPGGHHGGDQALGSAVGGPARGLHPPGAGRGGRW